MLPNLQKKYTMQKNNFHMLGAYSLIPGITFFTQWQCQKSK